MRSQTTAYNCDKCGKKLKTSHNSMRIVTSLSESVCWDRLHVNILRIHGVNNTSTTEAAELCQDCTANVLADALKRVRNGERATAGWERSNQEGWE